MKPIVKQVKKFQHFDVTRYYFELIGFDGRSLAISSGDQSPQRRDEQAKAIALQLNCSLGRARAKKDK